MSTSPIPSRRLNVLNGRSRSPSPATIPTAVHHQDNHNNHQPHTSLAEARSNFLNPENSNLYRTRRSTPNSTAKAEAHPSESIPLIDTESFQPPIVHPEVDDLGDDRETVDAPYPGVDDGFFSDRSNADGPSPNPRKPDESVDDIDGRKPVSRTSPRGSHIPLSPTDTEYRPHFPDTELGIPDYESIPDVNVYQHKKTLAQGMMDLALFSANANQLRYVLESDHHPYYYPGVVLISISLVLQVAIGVGLIWNARYNVKDDKEICMANRINNFTVIGIFLVTVVNVFVSAFGVASQPAPAATANP